MPIGFREDRTGAGYRLLPSPAIRRTAFGRFALIGRRKNRKLAFLSLEGFVRRATSRGRGRIAGAVGVALKIMRVFLIYGVALNSFA